MSISATNTQSLNEALREAASGFDTQTVVLLRIKQDFCNLTYGVSPCTAEVGVTGPDKCFNTTFTCQDRDNLDLGTKDLWFCSMRGNLPRPFLFNGSAIYVISSLKSASISPAEVNVGAGDEDKDALGTRGTLTVDLQDHPHSDNVVDKYQGERSYIATERGTFWTKWLQRNPYYQNTIVELYVGTIGQDVANMDRRTYVLDNIDGPSDSVSLTAKDVLKLADNDKAQAPKKSEGELESDITAGATTLTVSTTVDEYPSSGTVAIGDENISYTSKTAVSGGYELSGLTRGVDGTEADSHDAEEVVQLVLRYEDENVWDVMDDLIKNYTQVTTRIPGAVPYSEWQTEGDFWLSSYRMGAVIREPTGVNQLLGELTRDAPSMLYWDERVQELKLVAVKPSWPTVRNLSDDSNILADSVSVRRKKQNRFNEVWVFYQFRDNSKDLDEENNAKFIRVTLDADAQSDDEYGDRKVRKIYSRWIQTGSHAFELASTVLNRYRDAPTIIELKLTGKDRDFWLTDVASVKHRRFVNSFGAVEPRLFQVISVQESPGEDVLKYKMETFPFFGRFAGWMADDANDYSNATNDELLDGAWWSDENGLMPDGSEGYQWQ